MIVNLIHQALVANGFFKMHENQTTGFYVRENGTAIRFAVLHRLEMLTTPGDLNESINQSAPVSFTTDPAFRKNCDLICIHHLALFLLQLR